MGTGGWGQSDSKSFHSMFVNLLEKCECVNIQKIKEKKFKRERKLPIENNLEGGSSPWP